MPDSTRGRAPEETCGTVSSGDVVALGMAAHCVRPPGNRVAGARSAWQGACMSGAPTLTDGTVTVRAHRDDDLAGSSSRARTPTASGGRPYPRRTGSRTRERFVREVMPDGWADGRWGFAVEADGRYAGTVELRDEGGGRAELAFGSHPWARGTGTMERALPAGARLGLRRAGRPDRRVARPRRQLGLTTARLAARLLLRRHPARLPPPSRRRARRRLVGHPALDRRPLTADGLAGDAGADRLGGPAPSAPRR